MNCPACPRTDIEPQDLACPNCGLDLAPLHRLHELSEFYGNEAIALCERGRYAEALQKMMTAAELGEESSRVHILLGKILWKLDRREEAVPHWRRAAERDPECEEAGYLLEMGARELSRARRKTSPIRIAAVALALAAFISFALLFVEYRYNHRFANAEVEKLRRDLAEKKSSGGRGSAVEALQALVSRLEAETNLRAGLKGNKVAVVPREGFFLGGSDQLTPSARKQLAKLAGVLGQQDSRFRVVVEGVTDDVPPSGGQWKENWSLGYARAYSAMSYVRQLPGSSRTKWLVTSSGQSNPPYPNDSEENRRRNRSVLLEISLEPGGGGTMRCMPP